MKKNEGLERWVEDLLKTLDGVMEKTLGTAVERDSGSRVKEVCKWRVQPFLVDMLSSGRMCRVVNKVFPSQLMKQIDSRLSQDSSDETIIAEEVRTCAQYKTRLCY